MSVAGAARHGARLAAWLGDVILPPRCPACLVETATHAALCAACWKGLALIERPYCERLGLPFAFDPPAREFCRPLRSPRPPPMARPARQPAMTGSRPSWSIG